MTRETGGLVLVDAFDLGVNPKGISRVLSSLVPALDALAGDRLLVACTSVGAAVLDLPAERLVLVPHGLQSAWEQVGLPLAARRAGATAVYSHRETSALWGPPLVLHVPEDPEVRWSRQPAAGPRDRARRTYSRALMRPALRRAAVVAASVPSVAAHLRTAYGLPDVRVLPLGVDLELFTPTAAPAGDAVFHLGSPDPRDRTDLVVEAYAAALRLRPDLPPLVIGGGLGAEVTARVVAAAQRCSVKVRLPGRLSDADLAQAYRQALVVVQPSSDEGFGLQPLEALASGAPLVVTPAAAVVDVIGEAAVVAAPGDVGAAIAELAGDAARRARLRAAGPAQAAGFTWAGCAVAVLQALDDATSPAAVTSATSSPATRRGPRA